jgi:hypothetical protein
MADNDDQDVDQDIREEMEELKLKLVDLQNKLVQHHNKFEEEGRPTMAQACIIDPISSIPVYDSTKTTPTAFTLEIEEHLTWKSLDPDKWLLLVHRMFLKDSDIARWWRESKTTIKTWDEFKLAFLKYEESGQSKDNLYSKLFAKKQGLTEAFETFAWDVNQIYRKIDPAIDVKLVIERIVNSSLPEISVVLRNYNFQCVADLIFKAREIIVDLNKVRRLEKRPMLRARSSDPIEYRGEYRGDRGASSSSYHTDRHTRKWYNRNRDLSQQGTAQSQGSNEPQPQQRWESSNQSSSSGTGANALPSQSQAQGRKEDREFQPHAQGRKEDRECFFCKKKGHVIKDCRKRIYKESQNASSSQQGN